MGFFSYPHRALRPKANEDMLEQIFEAAGLGLAGDRIAHKLRMDPGDYARMREADPNVERAENQGRAQYEFGMSETMHRYARDGEDGEGKGAIKAAALILRSKHDWVEKKELNVNVEERISFTVALERARTRVIEGVYREVDEDLDAPEEQVLLPEPRTRARKAVAMPTFADDHDEDLD